jgi:drug/metabolite transporter (DMT)-like permease
VGALVLPVPGRGCWPFIAVSSLLQAGSLLVLVRAYRRFLALAAYATVLWAQSRTPLPLVSAVRETSLLFAGVIGTMIFGERFSVTRLAAHPPPSRESSSSRSPDDPDSEIA